MMRKERRGPRRSLPGSGVVSTISTDLLRCIFGPLERRDRPERDDDATKVCFLIECNNAFFQKREEVFERTRVLTFFHLSLSLFLSRDE